MTYHTYAAQEFYERVMEIGDMISIEEAEEASIVTLRSLAALISDDLARDTAEYLPPEVGAELLPPGGSDDDQEDGGDRLIDANLFIGPIMDIMNTEASVDLTLGGLDLVSVPLGDDAVARAVAVLRTVSEWTGPTLARQIRECLPPEIAAWLD